MESQDRSVGFLAWAGWALLLCGCYGSAAAIWSLFCVWGPNPATPPLAVALGLAVGLSQAWAASEICALAGTRARAHLRAVGLVCGCLPCLMPLLIAAASLVVKSLVMLSRALIGPPPPTAAHFTVGTVCGPPPVAGLFIVMGFVALLVQGVLAASRGMPPGAHGWQVCDAEDAPQACSLAADAR